MVKPALGMRRLNAAVRSACLRLLTSLCICLSLFDSSLLAQPYSPEELARITRDSVVTLTHEDRNGKHNGMGTGFVIADSGLIATSLHVIGEARRIGVRFANGQEYDVEAVHAWDRKLDLAVIKIAASGLTALSLGDSDQLRNGQSVVAIGNPMGLEQSIVTGIVSGIREFEHTEMIQLAIPIEPGNSGGPLLDLDGKVHGLLNLKSTLTENLGFATPVSRLKPLLEKPNSIPIHRWLRIGALNPDLWQTKMGGHWSQLTGRIKVTGAGSGFGGRALCLRQDRSLEFPYEIEVMVRLKDESGAAGLVFGADGGDRHYGFYPSNGQIRLTRFDGENVFSWNILHQIPSTHYRRGDWNHLRIRHQSDRIEGYLNGHQILMSRDRGLPIGQVGLAKFRNTEAEFKHFSLGPLRSNDALPDSPDRLRRITQRVGDVSGLDNEALVTALLDAPEAGQKWLIDQAQSLEQEARRLRTAGQTLHRKQVTQLLQTELTKPEEDIDLLRAALLISKHDKPEVPIDAYLDQIQTMVKEIREALPPRSDPPTQLGHLTRYLFQENGFHGSYYDYQNSANSYLDDVIDDREGLPITLSILFLELGRQLGIEGLTGFPLPYHFLVKYQGQGEDYRLIDVFNGGASMTYPQANALVRRYQNAPFQSDRLESSSKAEIINRMLRNLVSFTQGQTSLAASLPYLDLLVALNPETANFYLERAWVKLRTGRQAEARKDLQWILDHEPPGINLPRVREALESLP